jgi:hypothetical protein
MYEAAASCKDISRAHVTNSERLQDTVHRETRDVTLLFCSVTGCQPVTEQNNEQNTEHTLVRYDVLLQMWTGLYIDRTQLQLHQRYTPDFHLQF